MTGFAIGALLLSGLFWSVQMIVLILMRREVDDVCRLTADSRHDSVNDLLNHQKHLDSLEGRVIQLSEWALQRQAAKPHWTRAESLGRSFTADGMHPVILTREGLGLYTFVDSVDCTRPASGTPGGGPFTTSTKDIR